MHSFGKVSRWRKIVGWIFLATGIFNILGVIFNANGAEIGTGIFNSVVGVLFLSPVSKD